MESTISRGRVVAVLASLFFAASLAGCGVLASGDSLVGTEWVSEMVDGDQLVVAFTSDTDCELITIEAGEREVDDPDATWVREDDVVTITGDGSEFEFLIDGDTLTLSEGGQTLVFEKQ